MIQFPPKLELARLPTPLLKLTRFDVQAGAKTIWIKRDELTGTEVSGNKVRKLEFSLAQALSEGCDTIITCGGVQSNHCRATAVLGARLGLQVHLVLRGERPATIDGNLLLDYLAGATVSYVPDKDYHRHAEIAADLQKEYQRKRKKAFFIPIGASDEIGLWGYVAACRELQQDFQDQKISPDAIVVATGSGGTQSGLIVGNALFGLNTSIFAFNVCDDAAYFHQKFHADAGAWLMRYAASLPADFAVANLAVNTVDGYVGPGYGKADKEIFDTISLLARTEGIFLDPVYTGKAFHGMLQEMQSGCLQDARDIVFIHTGGLFGVFPQKSGFDFSGG